MLAGWEPPDRGALFVVSGPSGVGKSTLIQAALARIPDLRFSVSATTRAPRHGERDGVHYHFVGAERFARLVEQGAFLEHATVYDRRYGTLRDPTEQALSDGVSLILDIDVQGAAQVRDHLPEAVRIFVLPPSVPALEARLGRRGTEEPDVVRRRMALAAEQLRGVTSFDYVVVNDDLETARAAFEGILLAELSRRERRRTAIQRILDRI